jgi:hypothetical protein
VTAGKAGRKNGEHTTNQSNGIGPFGHAMERAHDLGGCHVSTVRKLGRAFAQILGQAFERDPVVEQEERKAAPAMLPCGGRDLSRRARGRLSERRQSHAD